MRPVIRWVLCAALAGSAAAADTGMRPGLWQVHILKQMTDGQDHSAQLAQAGDRMQQMMTNLSPAQRAKMQAMLKQRGIEKIGDNTFKVCISPAMAKNSVPVLDKDGRCRPASVNRHGAQTSYEFQCSLDGVTTTGKGVATRSGDTVTTHVDMTMQRADGTRHRMQNDTEMTFIAADCGEVKPPDSAPNAQK